MVEWGKDQARVIQKVTNRAVCKKTCSFYSLGELKIKYRINQNMGSSTAYGIVKNNTTGPKWSPFMLSLSYF